MSLLFVFEGDDTATGPHVDLGLGAHDAIIAAARGTHGGFPLARRLSDFYRDASFELDELEPLIAELRLLRLASPDSVDALVSLAQSALAADLGLLVICD